MPQTTPDPSHAAISTLRTGTPSVAVISRSFATARTLERLGAAGGVLGQRLIRELGQQVLRFGE